MNRTIGLSGKFKLPWMRASRCDYRTFILGILILLTTLSAFSETRNELKLRTYKPPRVLFNWDGNDAMRQMEWPATPGKLVRFALEEYAGSDIDTFLWSPGDGMSIFYHNTKIGMFYGDHLKDTTANGWFGADNGRRLREQGDEINILIKGAKRLRVKFYLSLRMNEQHDRISPMFWTPFKANHPQWLIGKYDPNNPDWNDWTANTGLNYAIPELREYRLRLIQEFADNYQFDGFQLDFMSEPPFFKKGEEESGKAVMTELVRSVRKIMDEVGKKRSQYIPLSVQVPETLKDSNALGLDLERWTREGLVDEIVAGRGYFEFFPLNDLIAMAHQYGVRVYANNNRNDPIEVSRAWAELHWQTGVDGLLLFNHYKEGRFPFINEIGRPERIARLSKTYKVGRKAKDPAVYLQNLNRLMGSYPGGQVPIDIEVNHPIQIHLDCYDDLDTAVADDAIKRIGIQLLFKTKSRGREDMFEFLTASLTPEDKFKITVNGAVVPTDSLLPLRPVTLSGVDAPYKMNTIYGVEWTQPISTIRKGANNIQIELVQRNPQIKNTLVLDGAQMQVEYR
jgi:hypothetical protein